MADHNSNLLKQYIINKTHNYSADFGTAVDAFTDSQIAPGYDHICSILIDIGFTCGFSRIWSQKCRPWDFAICIRTSIVVAQLLYHAAHRAAPDCIAQSSAVMRLGQSDRLNV